MQRWHMHQSNEPLSFRSLIFDTELIRALPSDGVAFNFQAEALAELAQRLRLLGGTLSE